MKKLLFIAIIFSASTAISQWVLCGGDEQLAGITSFASIGKSLFAGTGKGVYLTSDNGDTWKSVSTGLPNTIITSLAVIGTNLFAGTNDNGIFRSTDNGISWTVVNTGLTDMSIFTFAVNGTDLFAGTAYGVFRSTDNGASWIEADSGMGRSTTFALTMNSTNLFAGTYLGGVFRSEDNGLSWNFTGLSDLVQIMTFASTGTNIFAASGQDVFLSTDEGISWTIIDNGLTNTDVRSFAVNGKHIFAGTYGGGVSSSADNGKHWAALNSGLINLNVQALFTSDKYLFAGDSGVWRRPLSDFGISEVKVNNTSNYISISPNPTTGIITIRNTLENLTNISIFNILGEKVMEFSKLNMLELEIDLTTLPAGMYNARFVVGGSVFTEKILKQ